jgi:membrane protease YdiL (CAAX protease family)
MAGETTPERVTWLVAAFLVVTFALASYRHWLPENWIGPIGAGSSPTTVIPKELLQVMVVLTATLLISFAKGTSVATFGLPIQEIFGRKFWVGASWGFLMLSGTIGLMAATGSYRLGNVALSSMEIVKYGSLWAITFLLVGLAEELAFRGYLQYALTLRMGFWQASIVTSLFFAFAHRNNPGETWMGLANIVLIGIFACLALRRTGSLWFSIGWHMAFDWGESFFYSVSDSGALLGKHLFNPSVAGDRWLAGGTVGPEASLFSSITTLVGIALMAFWYREALYPEPR